MEDSHWISVENRLPDTMVAVNVVCKYGNKLITASDTGYYDKEKKKWFDHSNDFQLVDNFITHWQPLPKPPKN